MVIYIIFLNIEKFQIRVCEKAFLITTIVPLMQRDNDLDIIKSAGRVLSLLAKNPETHNKIINSGALSTIKILINNNLHFDITKYCISTLNYLTITQE